MPLSRLWLVMGNACADYAVKETLKNLPKPIQKLSHDILAWNTSEKTWLKHVCQFYLAVVKRRFDLAKLPENLNRHQSTIPGSEPGRLMPPKLFGNEAFEFLSTFDVVEYKPFGNVADLQIPEPDVLKVFLQGARLCLALCQWCKTLRWPPDVASDYKRETDWGIMWAELCANFFVVTGCFFPVKVQGMGSKATFVDFESDEAKLCPWSRKSLANQSVCLQRSFGALHTLTGSQWFPTFDSNKVTSLKHLQWNVQGAGIPCRPIMTRQRETMEYLKLWQKKPLTDAAIRPQTGPFLDIPILAEYSPDVRFKKYATFMYNKKKMERGAYSDVADDADCSACSTGRELLPLRTLLALVADLGMPAETVLPCA